MEYSSHNGNRFCRKEDMEANRGIRTIRLENILSFGPDTPELSLEPLNVFIGPNASGKSNLIEAMSLLGAAPYDLQEPIREGGGIRDWLWKGAHKTPTATVEVTLGYPMKLTQLDLKPFRYRISFTETWGRFELRDEVIEPERVTGPDDSYYQYRGGSPVINRKMDDDSPPSGVYSKSSRKI